MAKPLEMETLLQHVRDLSGVYSTGGEKDYGNKH